VCPTNALYGTVMNIQKINQSALLSSLRVEHLCFTCERTFALLRLEALASDSDGSAQKTLDLLEAAVASSNLLRIPCLAMPPAELWFSILNEIGVEKMQDVSIYLPVGQCELCPINAKDNVEDAFGSAISKAEAWAQTSVALLTDPTEVPQAHRGNIRAYLASSGEAGRREAFSGFFREMRETWNQASNSTIQQAQFETLKQRERRNASDYTRLIEDTKSPLPAYQRPKMVPARFLMIEALGRNRANAASLVLTVSTTDETLCTHCGNCIPVCPLRARIKVADKTGSGVLEPVPTPAPPDPLNLRALSAKEAGFEGPEVEFLEDAGAAGAAAIGDCTTAVEGGFDPNDVPVAALPVVTAPEPEPEPAFQVITDALFCTGCSACLQVCPTGACGFSTVTGESFLLEEAESE
jgi:ferredoxin